MADNSEIWIIPAVRVQLADGTTMIKPGKAIRRATAGQTSKLTGVQRKTLTALADCGLIRRQRPSPGQVFYFPGEVEDFLARTESEKDFWDTVRTRAFLKGSTLRTSTPI